MKRSLGCLAVFFSLTAVCLAQEGVDQKELKQLLAESYMIERDYDRSVKEYREILAKDPQNIKARTSLADVLSWQKKYDEAVMEYLKVIEIHPDDLEAKKKLAAVYAWKKDFPKSEVLYREILAKDPQDLKQAVAFAEVCFRLGQLQEAERRLQGVLEKDPWNRDARTLLADVYAGEKDFDQALKLYRELLQEKYDRKVKTKIGDVESWARDYRASINTYDELLAEKDKKSLRLQKARILGWAREYRQASGEYRKILEQSPDDLIRTEMEAKELYWSNRVKRAIQAYRDLLAKMPDNAEAMFDLSQIYSYQSVWREAIEQYKNILDLFPDHFRAREGLKKAELLMSHPVLSSGYEFFKAHSGARDVDIRKNAFKNLLTIPLNAQTVFEAGYNFTRRAFLDFHDLSENHARLGLSYQKSPDWSAGGFFNLVTYNRSVAPVYEFGGQFAFRTFDVGQMTLSQEQQRLENNSAVIRRRLFRNNFKVRQDVDITKRWKAGTDYTFSFFSDHNRCNEVAGDTLYFLMLEPRAFYVKYRYAFRNFLKVENDYFSPQEYSLHTISVRWKHFLNKEEVFFGANDLYYESGYDISFDSTGITSHQVIGGLTWDIHKRLQIKGEGQYTIASSKIYEDVGAKASIKFFF